MFFKGRAYVAFDTTPSRSAYVRIHDVLDIIIRLIFVIHVQWVPERKKKRNPFSQKDYLLIITIYHKGFDYDFYFLLSFDTKHTMRSSRMTDQEQ